jgi:phenylalanyl-tRNA synthetase beta chain
MKISYKWLQEIVDIDLSAQDLAEKLTLVGLELDGMHEFDGDYILDIETTSNRGDCLSHLGVAREIAVFSGKNLKLNVSTPDQTKTFENLVTIENSDLCHRFTARLIKNVKIKPSPDWLVRRLESIGERSINNVADITNYVMHELGQPMHAFDFDKLSGNRIIVKNARSGQKFTTLDEVERALDESMLMICDQEQPIAVGGVMGGLHSGITNNTVNVLLEVAYFDRDNIRTTSNKLNLATEASYHFERGVDIENLISASNRATKLICELAEGTPDGFIDVYPKKYISNHIYAPNLQKEIKRLSGLTVEQNKIDNILKSLGLEKTDENQYKSPTWRNDLSIDEDLVEEVVRIVGYDQIGEELPYALSSGEYQPNEIRKKRLRQSLSTIGFNESITYSFIDSKFDNLFDFIPEVAESNDEFPFISIKDPIIEGATRMRQTLLAGLLDAVKTNFNHQNKNIKLFEIGKIFTKSKNENNLPNEIETLGIILTGEEKFENRVQSNRQLDFYDLKGAVELCIDSLKLAELVYQPKNFKHLQSGQSAELLFDSKPIGSMGKLDSGISTQYKFKQPVYLAEINLQALLNKTELPAFYQPLPIYPGIQRDVSLLVKRDNSFEEIRDKISEQNFELCRNVQFVDIFEGKGMADDERSITIRLDYRSNERTLVEDEVEMVHQQILDSITSNFDLKLR